MKPFKTDVAVLILFFNRPEALKNVWSAVCEARPSQLFLYQDGPRNEKDMLGIKACREIVNQIDWECDVHRCFQSKNYGCDPSEFMSQKWALSIADRCIILEDDSIPSATFFPFCKEMLDRYANDPRIMMIQGMNYDEITPNIPYDYFFTTAFSISGWATWRRVIELCDEHYSFLDDSYDIKQLEHLIDSHQYQKNFLEFCKYHRQTGKAYYETILHAAIFLNNGMAIVPRVNMVGNLGACGEGVHLSGTNATLPKAYRRIFEMKSHNLKFPLRHPKYVFPDIAYKERMFKIQGWGHPWIKIGRSFEEFYLTIRHGQFKRIIPAITHRLRKLLGRAHWN